MTMANDKTQHPRLSIAITRALPPPVIELFKERHNVWVNPDDRTLTPDELQQAAKRADALVVTAFNRLDADAIALLPAGLRIIATYSVGIEHIDLEAAGRRGIAVLSTPDVLSDSVAEMAILLMLGAARRVHEGNGLLYDRSWAGWTPTQLVGIQVTGAVSASWAWAASGARSRVARAASTWSCTTTTASASSRRSRKAPAITPRSRACRPRAMFSCWPRPRRRRPRGSLIKPGSR